MARRLRHNPGLKLSSRGVVGIRSGRGSAASQEAGFNAHLAKPVRLESLKALLASEDVR